MPTTHGGARPGAGRKPISEGGLVRVTVSVPREIAAAWESIGGDDNASEGARIVTLSWLDAHAPARYPGRRVELWRHSSGARFAVLCERGRPILAAGPLTHAEAAGVIAGDTDFDWSSALADDINAEDEQGDEAAYRRVRSNAGLGLPLFEKL